MMSSLSFCVPETVLTVGLSLPDCKLVEPGRVVTDDLWLLLIHQITDWLAARSFQLLQEMRSQKAKQLKICTKMLIGDNKTRGQGEV